MVQFANDYLLHFIKQRLWRARGSIRHIDIDPSGLRQKRNRVDVVVYYGAGHTGDRNDRIVYTPQGATAQVVDEIPESTSSRFLRLKLGASLKRGRIPDPSSGFDLRGYRSTTIQGIDLPGANISGNARFYGPGFYQNHILAHGKGNRFHGFKAQTKKVDRKDRIIDRLGMSGFLQAEQSGCL